MISLPLPDVAFFGIVLLLVIGIWEGNRLFERWIANTNQPTIAKRLIRQFLLSMMVVIAVTGLAVLLFEAFASTPTTLIFVKLIIGFTFRINLFLQCINAIIVYNQELSDSKIEAEKLKKETTEAQFESLRSQVNPHFLFNSFNVLTSLIETDPKTGVQFVEQLSVVYRYLLKTQEVKMTSLKEELDFLQSYIFLLKIRFQSNLKVEVEVEPEENVFLPPSTLQMLIENAIKHNEVSRSKPLEIVVKRLKGMLEVSNNLSPKSNKEESSQVGLKNISSRYLLLGGEAPIVTNDGENFRVRIPLIKQ